MSDVVESDQADNGEPLDPTIDVIRAHIACVTEELGDLNAEILSHRARWSRLCALVMTVHREDGLPTQEVAPDEMVAVVERVFAREASLGDAVAAERERCARVAEAETNDVEIEDALTSEGIFTWGPDGERFDRMFNIVATRRGATIRQGG